MVDRTPGRQLDKRPKVERSYVPDEAAVLQALRVVLGLPRRLPASQEGQG
jgi:hypothetical protein